jgi:hypothetical protein
MIGSGMPISQRKCAFAEIHDSLLLTDITRPGTEVPGRALPQRTHFQQTVKEDGLPFENARPRFLHAEPGRAIEFREYVPPAGSWGHSISNFRRGLPERAGS